MAGLNAEMLDMCNKILRSIMEYQDLFFFSIIFLLFLNIHHKAKEMWRKLLQVHMSVCCLCVVFPEYDIK